MERRSSTHRTWVSEHVWKVGRRSYNYRVHLTARPGTRLALSAPRPLSPTGRAQGARPPRPAGDAGRSTSFEKE